MINVKNESKCKCFMIIEFMYCRVKQTGGYTMLQRRWSHDHKCITWFAALVFFITIVHSKFDGKFQFSNLLYKKYFLAVPPPLYLCTIRVPCPSVSFVVLPSAQSVCPSVVVLSCGQFVCQSVSFGMLYCA